jgi:hypothetical protein
MKNILKNISKLVFVIALLFASVNYTFAQTVEETNDGKVYNFGEVACFIPNKSFLINQKLSSDRIHQVNRFIIFEGDSSNIKSGAFYCASFNYKNDKDAERVEKYFSEAISNGKIKITGKEDDDLHFLQYYCDWENKSIHYWMAPDSWAGDSSKGFSVRLPDNFEEVFDNALSDATIREHFATYLAKTPSWNNEK